MIISEWNSNKINGFWQWIKKWVQLLIRFYNDTVCIHDHNITLQRVRIGTWNQIIFKLAKRMHPTQRSHSKTHWICIENFQTKHEAWGCFKLNITPLYNKKWSSGLLFFFSLHGITINIQKNVYMQTFYRCQILLWYNKSIWPVLENSYDHKISDWGAIVIINF